MLVSHPKLGSAITTRRTTPCDRVHAAFREELTIGRDHARKRASLAYREGARAALHGLYAAAYLSVPAVERLQIAAKWLDKPRVWSTPPGVSCKEHAKSALVSGFLCFGELWLIPLPLLSGVAVGAIRSMGELIPAPILRGVVAGLCGRRATSPQRTKRC